MNVACFVEGGGAAGGAKKWIEERVRCGAVESGWFCTGKVVGLEVTKKKTCDEGVRREGRT